MRSEPIGQSCSHPAATSQARARRCAGDEVCGRAARAARSAPRCGLRRIALRQVPHLEQVEKVPRVPPATLLAAPGLYFRCSRSASRRRSNSRHPGHSPQRITCSNPSRVIRMRQGFRGQRHIVPPYVVPTISPCSVLQVAANAARVSLQPPPHLNAPHTGSIPRGDRIDRSVLINTVVLITLIFGPWADDRADRRSAPVAT